MYRETGNLRAVVGSTWTTDAPFRETADAIEAARSKGALAVEMEAAALYTFARATGASVLCLAHVTNTMGQAERDFEKGEADGEEPEATEAIAEPARNRHHREVAEEEAGDDGRRLLRPVDRDVHRGEHREQRGDDNIGVQRCEEETGPGEGEQGRAVNRAEAE